MGTFDRGEQIVVALTQLGVRATTDPAVASPPCVLVMPPARTFDLPCGFTARWTVAALAPGALGADRSTWAALDHLAEIVAQVVDLDTAELVSYVLNGVAFPAYLCNFEETMQ